MSLALDWLRPKKGEDPMAFIDDVFRYAFARTRNREEAEDIAIEVVQSLPNPCRKDNLRVYMLGMARRKVADHFRRRRAAPIHEADTTTRFDSRSDDAALVGATLAMLSDEYREALTLKYIVGLSSQEIAELNGKSPTAIDSLLQRARGGFAEAWEQITGEEEPR